MTKSKYVQYTNLRLGLVEDDYTLFKKEMRKRASAKFGRKIELDKYSSLQSSIELYHN